MTREDDFSKSSVAIVGLGLMGGSLALALRGHCKQLIGVDQDPRVLDLALRRGVVDFTHTDPGAILPQADIVILAMPVSAILELLKRLPEFHPGPAVVLDLGSTKTEIMHEMEKLPPEFDPVGGHPMCGKETSGLENADPDIYQGAAFALTALERTSPEARVLIEGVVRAIGASPIWLDPEIHDTWVATTSHLPYLMAVALVGATSMDAASLLGPGYLGASRLAGSSPEMMADILLTNHSRVMDALKQHHAQLEIFGQAVQKGDRDQLIAQLEIARHRRQNLLEERGKG